MERSLRKEVYYTSKAFSEPKTLYRRSPSRSHCEDDEAELCRNIPLSCFKI